MMDHFEKEGGATQSKREGDQINTHTVENWNILSKTIFNNTIQKKGKYKTIKSKIF